MVENGNGNPCSKVLSHLSRTLNKKAEDKKSKKILSVGGTGWGLRRCEYDYQKSQRFLL